MSVSRTVLSVGETEPGGPLALMLGAGGNADILAAVVNHFEQSGAIQVHGMVSDSVYLFVLGTLADHPQIVSARDMNTVKTLLVQSFLNIYLQIEKSRR